MPDEGQMKSRRSEGSDEVKVSQGVTIRSVLVADGGQSAFWCCVSLDAFSNLQSVFIF